MGVADYSIQSSLQGEHHLPQHYRNYAKTDKIVNDSMLPVQRKPFCLIYNKMGKFDSERSLAASPGWSMEELDNELNRVNALKGKLEERV